MEDWLDPSQQLYSSVLSRNSQLDYVRAISRPFQQFDVFRLEKVRDDFCPMAWRPVLHKYFAIMHCHVYLQLLFHQFQIFFVSMTGSAQHELAKWLTSLLQPVLQDLSANCVSDSFTFVEEVRNFTFSPSSVFLCSFDISSLFTNVPLPLKPYKFAPTPCTITTSYRSHLFHVTSSSN